jgi:hypothetical protein
MVDFCPNIGPVQQEFGFGFFGHHFAVSSIDNMTARAGGGQRSNADLNEMINRVTTVATAGDSGTLPVARKGLRIVVISTSVISMNIFPGVGDTINNLSKNAALAFIGSASGNYIEFICVSNGQWQYFLGGAVGSGTANGLFANQIPLSGGVTPTGVPMTATPGVGTFGVSFAGGASVALTGETTSSNSKTDTVYFDFFMPPSYVAGNNFTVTVNCQVAGAGTLTVQTVNAHVYLISNAGAASADLTSIGAQSLGVTPTDVFFPVTGTTVSPGSHLSISVVTVVTSSAGSNNSVINSVRVS